MRLKNLFIASFLLMSTAIFAIEGTVKIANSEHNTAIIINSGNGNVVPGEVISVLNMPSEVRINDVLIVRYVEMGPANNRKTVAIFVGLQ